MYAFWPWLADSCGRHGGLIAGLAHVEELGANTAVRA
jgi:hypothetical protein